MSDEYIHGRSPEEAERLRQQASFIGETLLDGVVVPAGRRRLLDLGCGVGAMTDLLVTKGASLPVGVDRSRKQLRRAVRLNHDRAVFAVADGARLPFREAAFDSIFTSWLFEHVPDPLALLREAFRVLAPGGELRAAEVENATLRTWPPSPAIEAAWGAFNAAQVRLHGDPFIGRRMFGLLQEAGFVADAWPHTFHEHAARDQRFREVTREFAGILRSGREGVVDHFKLLDGETYERASVEFERLPDVPGATFTYTFIRCSGKKP
jgi:SAM-dependent methyltransferase